MPTPPPLSHIPTPQDTEDAEQALVFARSYIDDYYDKKNAASAEDNAAIGFASKYLAEARAKDPRVTLTTPAKDGSPVTQTQDMLASEVLYIEACTYGSYESSQKKALEAIKKAIAYAPDYAYLHRKAAEIFLKLERREDAIKAARYALSLNPRDIESRKLVDRVEATPSLGVKQKEPGTSVMGMLLLLAGAGCVFVAPFIAFAQENYLGMILVPIVFGAPLCWLGGKLLDRADRRRLEHKAEQREFYKDK